MLRETANDQSTPLSFRMQKAANQTGLFCCDGLGKPRFEEVIKSKAIGMSMKKGQRVGVVDGRRDFGLWLEGGCSQSC